MKENHFLIIKVDCNIRKMYDKINDVQEPEIKEKL